MPSVAVSEAPLADTITGNELVTDPVGTSHDAGALLLPAGEADSCTDAPLLPACADKVMVQVVTHTPGTHLKPINCGVDGIRVMVAVKF